MTILADVALAVVALLHIGFLVLEMFLWSKPIGQRVFGLPPNVMVASAPLAASQGLYNGFLAAGLLWGLVLGIQGFDIKVFFLLCVIVAGVFGAATAERSILWIQATPGAVALLLVLLTRP
jgi:putative membrane protein